MERRPRIAVLYTILVSITTRIMCFLLGRVNPLLSPLGCGILMEEGMNRVEDMLARVCNRVVIYFADMYADNCLIQCTRTGGKCSAYPITLKHPAAQPLMYVHHNANPHLECFLPFTKEKEYEDFSQDV